MIQRSHTRAWFLVLTAGAFAGACGKVDDSEAISGADDDGFSSGGRRGNDDGADVGTKSGGAKSDGGSPGIGGSETPPSTTGGQASGGRAPCEGECGPELLGGAAGECEGEECEPACTPDCDGRACGDDGCDGSCGSCPDDSFCSEAQSCELDTRPSTEMSSLSGGTFLMGAEDLNDMASPVHERTVAPFSIDRTEVTAGAYDACVAAEACSPVENNGGLGQNSGSPEFSEYPVNYVIFEQAEQFCAWMGKRLPSETEWEYAAGGALGYLYPWGDGELDWQGCAIAGASDPPEFIYDLEIDFEHGCRVGQFPPGAHGLYDMAGGVWELVDAPWCAYSSETESGYSEENNSLITCNEGPVLRGSGFTNGLYPPANRISYREWGLGLITNGHQGVGFRCAKSN